MSWQDELVQKKTVEEAPKKKIQDFWNKLLEKNAQLDPIIQLPVGLRDWHFRPFTDDANNSMSLPALQGSGICLFYDGRAIKSSYLMFTIDCDGDPPHKIKGFHRFYEKQIEHTAVYDLETGNASEILLKNLCLQKFLFDGLHKIRETGGHEKS